MSEQSPLFRPVSGADPHQPPLRYEPVVRARNTDPETSHEAAASVKGLRPRQEAVLALLRSEGPCTDEQIAQAYRTFFYGPQQSPSGLRTRRRELVDLGLVEDSGERRLTASGRRSVVWRAVAQEAAA